MRTNKLRFRSSIAIVVALVVISLYFAMSAFMTRGMSPTIEHQLLALQAEDYVAAYADTSRTFRETTSLEKFKTLVQSYPVFSNNKDVTILSKKIVDGKGIVKARIRSRTGVERTAKYQLANENGTWKISSIILYKNRDSDSSQEVDSQTDTASEKVALPNNYANERFRFAINYPADWEYTQPNTKTVLFSEKHVSSSTAPAITVQPVLHQDDDGRYKSVNDVVQTATKKTNASVIERGKVIVNPSRGERLDGRYVILSYQKHDNDYKQLNVIFYKEEDRALYVLEYSAPAKVFNTSLPIAKAMTQSFTYE